MREDRPPRLAAIADALLVAVVAALVYGLHGFDGVLNRDLGVFTYGGERVAAGVPPYAGIFNTVGPFADAVPGAAIWVGDRFGIGAISAERHLFWLLSVACCVLVMVLGRLALGSRSAGFVAAAVFLTFEDFLHLATDGPREKTVMVLFLLAAFVLLLRRRWALAGACTAVATLTWQPVAAVAVTAAVVALATTPAAGWRVRLRWALAYVVGGLVPTLAVVGLYLARGQLRLALDGFVVVDAEYVRQTSLLTDPGGIVHELWVGYAWSLPLLLAGLLALLGAAIPLRSRPRSGPLLVLGAAGLVGAAWSVAVVNGAPDLFELLPLGALGVAAVVVRLGAGLRRGGPALVAAVVVLAVGAATIESVSTRDEGLLRQRRDVAAVLAAAPGARILSIGTPEVLGIARRVNPSSWQLFDEGLDQYYDQHWPGGMRGYATWIHRTRPTLVTRTAGGHEGWPNHVLAHDYVFAGRGPRWNWYLARDAGRAELCAVRAANRDLRPAAATAADRAPAAPTGQCAPRVVDGRHLHRRTGTAHRPRRL